MNISYSHPLELGWRRMKQTLFQPFDLGRWFVLGFTAWLAQLGSSGGFSDGSSYRVQEHLGGENLRETGANAWRGVAEFLSHPFGVALVTFIVIFVLLIAVLFIWLSSRGRFIFLDNLIHHRTEVHQPWHEFQAQGDSLFLWRLGYNLVAMILGTLVLGGFVLVLLPVLGLPDGLRLLTAIGLGIVGFCFMATALFIEYFLDHFVVPIMYQRRLRATEAWSVFLGLFQSRPGAFVLFGLFYLAIIMVMGLAYFIGGLLTCCVGILLLAIPYIGTVVSLPIPVLGQFMSLEFLAQFGADFNLLPPQPTPDPDGSGQFDADGTMVRPIDLTEDAGGDQTGPQDS